MSFFVALMIVVVPAFILSIIIVNKFDKKLDIEPEKSYDPATYFSTLQNGRETILKSLKSDNLENTNVWVYASDISRFYNYLEIWQWLDELVEEGNSVNFILQTTPSKPLFEKAIKNAAEKSFSTQKMKKIMENVRMYQADSGYMANAKNEWIDSLLVKYKAENGKVAVFITSPLKPKITENTKDKDIISEGDKKYLISGRADLYNSSKNAYICRVANNFFDEIRKISQLVEIPRLDSLK